MHMAYTEANRQPNANTAKRIKTAKEKLERVLKELKDTGVPKELKDTKAADQWISGSGGRHRKRLAATKRLTRPKAT
jgi:hypothetical protein